MLFLLAAAVLAPPPPPYLHAPAVNEYARFNPAGRTILPDGRYLQPEGRSVPVGDWPNGLAIGPDGRTAFVGCESTGAFITGCFSASPGVRAAAPGAGAPSLHTPTCSGAAVFSRDGRTLYWSSGEDGRIWIVDVGSGRSRGAIDLNGRSGGRAWSDSFVMAMAPSADGRLLYCADVTNFRLAVVDTVARRVLGSAPAGRYPYAVAVSGSRVYVADIGMFRYTAVPKPSTAIPARAGETVDARGMTYPAYGFPSPEARSGIDIESRHIPGLGDPNTPESFSVACVDVADPSRPRVVARIKTGLLVGAPADNGKTIGGSAPNFLTLHGSSLYVTDGNNDLVERIDTATNRVTGRIRLSPSPLVARLRGVSPTGSAVSPDGRRLYVAEWGLNAIAVIDTRAGAVLGHIPTAWYPYRIAVSRDGRRLGVICFRGFGNGPSAGAQRTTSPFRDMKGTYTVLDAPSDLQLRALTRHVLENNGIVNRAVDRRAMSSPVIPTAPGRRSAEIKYVVFITKENHTYDTIFDRVPGANDDPSLLRWGLHQQITGAGREALDDVPVMTNHNALARQFTVSDNFYLQPEFSGVGHRWLVGVQPDNWCQLTYTLGWNFKGGSGAPGRLASFDSNGSMAPEDYPEAGSMWHHLAHFGIGFRNYGEGFEFAGVQEGADEARTGARETVNIPMPKPLFDNTCRGFPIFNLNIPDQYRAWWFEQDFRKLWLDPGKAPPPFLNIAICCDHGTDPAPARGYPYRASWMADNDLALGRIVAFLSQTPYWRNMAIFVTEDDSGGEPDHVDAQRSVMLVISPWARHGYVSHRHTTVLSVHRTLYEILGLPPLNMFDALANDFSDCFTTQPDYTPYTVAPVDPRVFDPEKAKDPRDPDYGQAPPVPAVAMDDAAAMRRMVAGAARETKPARASGGRR